MSNDDITTSIVSGDEGPSSSPGSSNQQSNSDDLRTDFFKNDGQNIRTPLQRNSSVESDNRSLSERIADDKPPENGDQEEEESSEDNYVNKMQRLSIVEKRQKEREINNKKRIDELEEQNTAYKQKIAEEDEFLKLSKQNPKEFLRRLQERSDMSIDDVINASLAEDDTTLDDLTPKERELSRKLKELEDREEKREKDKLDDAKKQEEDHIERQVQQYYSGLHNEVDQGDYPYVRAAKGYEMCEEVANILAKKHGKTPEYSDVAKRVNDYYRNEYEKHFPESRRKPERSESRSLDYRDFESRTLSDSSRGGTGGQQADRSRYSFDKDDDRSDDIEDVFKRTLKFT